MVQRLAIDRAGKAAAVCIATREDSILGVLLCILALSVVQVSLIHAAGWLLFGVKLHLLAYAVFQVLALVTLLPWACHKSVRTANLLSSPG